MAKQQHDSADGHGERVLFEELTPDEFDRLYDHAWSTGEFSFEHDPDDKTWIRFSHTNEADWSKLEDILNGG